jgi:hypothetical protein
VNTAVLSPLEMAGQVTLGATDLDGLEEFVGDWRSKIDLEILNIASATHCILGQLTGNFWRGLPLVGGAYRMAADRGLCIDAGRRMRMSTQDTREAYALLTKFWGVAVLTRQSSDIADRLKALSL